jgi:hypothetical protein
MAIGTTAYVLGAGFSANAGLPLQSDFTERFLRANQFKRGKSRFLMPHLGSFVRDTFGFKDGQDSSLYPELEDVFTTLDLSANTGHNLGRKYSPSDLRRLRRMLLSRIIRMLNAAYLDGKKEPSKDRKQLLSFLKNVSCTQHEFVSLNWDTVLEGCFEELEQNLSPCYSNEIHPVIIEEGKVKPIERAGSRILVAKMHGSINWLYCDCCRRTFSVPVSQVSLLASQVLKSDESKKLYGESMRARLECPLCDVDLGVRLATFSYQKALRTSTFESSWLQAEKTLMQARRWVFIGYSLPGADFEFKYLLKRVALSLRRSPEIVVVTKINRQEAIEKNSTVISYQRFFGEGKPRFFYDSLTADAIKDIL